MVDDGGLIASIAGDSGSSDSGGGGGGNVTSSGGSSLAGGGAFGDMMSGAMSGIMNYASAKQTRDWQFHLSSTAHQREVADLKAAGLNPVLSAGGSGASTPSGATPDIPAISNPVGKYLEYVQQQAVIRNSQADTSQKVAAARNLEESTRTQVTQQQANAASALRDLSSRDLNSVLQSKAAMDASVSAAQAGKLHWDTLNSMYEARQNAVKKGLYDLIPLDTIRSSAAGVKDFLGNVFGTFFPGLSGSH